MPPPPSPLASVLAAIFPPSLARWVAAPATSHPLEQVLPAVWQRSQLAVLLARLVLRHPLPHRSDVLLALHLAGASFEQLREIAALEPDHLVRNLLQARRHFVEHWTAPCCEGAAAIARWRELDREPDLRRALLLHLRGCAACRQALATCRTADERALVASPQPVPTRRAAVPRWRILALVLAAVLVLALLRFATGLSVPAPSPSEASRGDGPFLWLGSSGTYSVAFALPSRQWVPVAATLPADAGGYRLLDPSGQLIAAWTPDPPREPRWLDVLTLEGERVVRWRWDRTTTRRPLAWLDRSTLLVREVPSRPPYEREAEFFERVQRQSRVLALTVPSGQESTLLPELVTDAVPAPDGKTLALVRAMEPFGSGATSRTIELHALDGTQRTRLIARAEGYVGGTGDRPLWLPDSSGIVFPRRPERAPPTLPSPTEVALLGRDGTLRILLPARRNTIARPLAVAPDRSRLIALRKPIGQSARGEVIDVDLATLRLRRILDLDRLAGPIGVHWYGEVPILVVVRTLPNQEASTLPSECTELYALGPESPALIGSAPGRWGFDAWGNPLLMLRSDLPQHPESPVPPGSDFVSGPLRLAPGARWFLASPAPGHLALWAVPSGIQLSEAWQFDDGTWHPTGFGFSAVGRDGRLVLVSRSPDGFWYPAVIGPPDGVTVSAIAVGPDGRLAFWHQKADGSLTLLLGFPPELQPIARPGIVAHGARPCAAWRSSGRLLLAEPRDGERVQLSEITLHDGSVTVRTLARYRPLPGRPIEGCELAVDPSGQWLALRVDGSDRSSVLLVPLVAPDDDIVLARGNLGRSLAWSPDGARLAVALGREVSVWSRSRWETQQRGIESVGLAWIDATRLWLLVEEGERARLLAWTLTD